MRATRVPCFLLSSLGQACAMCASVPPLDVAVAGTLDPGLFPAHGARHLLRVLHLLFADADLLGHHRALLHRDLFLAYRDPDVLAALADRRVRRFAADRAPLD